MSEVAIWTDPARELAELCDAISPVNSSQTKGETHLADHFGVNPWSREFYEITFTIMDRIKHVTEIVSSLPIDEDIRDQAVSQVRGIGNAFTAASLRQSWATTGQPATGAANVQPLKMLSVTVRQHIKYRKLDSAEVQDILADVSKLRSWLEERQLSEQDFIRQAIIEGLRQFEFRLARLQWLGWGYALEGLRDVLAAYMALERSGISPTENPDAEAVLKKLGAVVKRVYEKVAVAKDVTEAGDLLLRAYGLVAGSTWVTTNVVGLIGNS